MRLKRLKELRDEQKWSINVVAEKLFIAKSTYAGYEYGRRDMPNEIMNRVADLYKVSVDYIFGRVNSKYSLVDNPAITEFFDNLELGYEELYKRYKLVIDGKPIDIETFRLFYLILSSIKDNRMKIN